MALFDERLQLAQDVADRLLAEHGDVIVAIGLHGSMAHREIDERSDLDFAIVTKASDDLDGRDVLYGDVLLSLSPHGAEEYLEEAGQVDDGWAVESDQFVSWIALHDPDGFFETLRETQERAAQDDERFDDRARENVVGAQESLGKAERMLDRGSEVGAEVCLVFALASQARAVGLLKRVRWRGEHTAVASAGDVSGRIDGFASAYAVASDPAVDLGVRVERARVATCAIERYLAERGVMTTVESLDGLLD